jgi:hypothetical protein
MVPPMKTGDEWLDQPVVVVVGFCGLPGETQPFPIRREMDYERVV